MAIAEKLWVLDLDKETGNGVAVETITTLWADATGWIEAYGGEVFIGLVVLVSAVYLIWVGTQTQT